MEVRIVDLYQYCGRTAPDGAGATLQMLAPLVVAGAEKRTRPAILVIPGGGYSHVSEREAEPVALRFCTRGYVAFVLRYSCWPQGFPVALREAAMAMRYIRENAGALGIDPQMVAAIGFSAGGHLCGCLGTMFDGTEVADIGSPELLRPDALGLCYPVAVSWGATHEGSFQALAGADLQLRQRLSLDHCVRPDMPPVFLWHTRNDESVPVRNSLVLAVALEEAGVPFAMHIYPKGPHGLSTGDVQVYRVDQMPRISPEVPGWPELLMSFLQEHGFDIKDTEV